ncbi:MAG: hypothetical protein KKE59_04245, partial [Proteobacteria bacterium]|nr:hypothetical protein [Pseudomonadota bacterium]
MSIHKWHLSAQDGVLTPLPRLRRHKRFFAILNVASYACGCKKAAAFRLRLKASPRHVSRTKIYNFWM